MTSPSTALRPSSGCISSSARAIAEAHDRDHVERAVGLAISTRVEAVAPREARGSRDWICSTNVSEGGFVTETLNVLASGNEHLCRVMCADAK